MNIAQALKEKNRIAGKISKLQDQIKESNQYEEGKEKDFNSAELLIQLEEQWAFLINLKTKIAKANVGIAEKLIGLTEAKAELSFWDRMTSYSGKSVETATRQVWKDARREEQEYNNISSITSLEVANHHARVQKLIEDLQDEIDNYNATTQI